MSMTDSTTNSAWPSSPRLLKNPVWDGILTRIGLPPAVHS